MVIGMWSIRAQRRTLLAGALLCLAIAVGVWLWALLGIDHASTPGITLASSGDGLSPGGRTASAASQENIDGHALRLAANGLEPQRPLFDPPPRPVAPPPPPPPPRLRLVGTIVGRGEPQAILATPDGRMIFGRIDQVVESARIAAITPESVELVVQDQTHVLRVAAE